MARERFLQTECEDSSEFYRSLGVMKIEGGKQNHVLAHMGLKNESLLYLAQDNPGKDKTGFSFLIN